MLRKLFCLVLMVLYIYMLTFDIFLNVYLRFPTPVLFCLPLLLFYKNTKYWYFVYGREISIFLYAGLFYFLIAQADMKQFFVMIIKVVFCAIYFNYFIGKSRARFNNSVLIFFSLLFVSALVMLFNHGFPDKVNAIRAVLVGDEIVQSPSGITAKIFTFGYQLAALVTFCFIYVCTLRKSVIISAAVMMVCLVLCYYGMERSVLVVFLCACVFFVIFYYRFWSILILGVCLIIGAILYSADLASYSGSADNIFSKNKRNIERREQRSDLVKQNLKIYANYPWGLMFYGKQWSDVIKKNPVFAEGITSHNAYMMFFTYLGPVLGIALLVALFFMVGKIFRLVLKRINNKDYALLVSLWFAFFAVFINAFVHNAWLLEANGPTLFLYFAIIHFYKNFLPMEVPQRRKLVMVKTPEKIKILR